MSRSGLFVPLLLLLLLSLFLSHEGEAASIRRNRRGAQKTCGYEACPAVHPAKLNIHMVAHTHDDVGWLKTVDQYYFGSRSMIQKAGVQYILDSVIRALLANPDRKFIYVETAFLWKWWLRQSPKTQEDVRMLINEGRLEIIGGGWSMNDEAVTHYHSLVDQYTWGFRRLNDTFGSCARPHVGWQIDPFGHSREQASMFAQMGFDGMFFGRMDYQDKAKRLMDKTMEMVWKGSPSLGPNADLFTVALYNHYSPPPGFCFDILCADEPIIDDPKSPDYNVKERVDAFLKFSVEQSIYYRTKNIILTMGGDFTYQDAEMYFTNMERLMRYVTDLHGDEVNIFFSTPSCYLKAVNENGLSWTTKNDDFFPYASDPHSYWTGYFSSRPAVKFYERMGNNLLQISKQLSAITSLANHEEALEYLREAMGVMQHHDAVTGTEKQLVADDYARILYDSMRHGEKIVVDSLSKWMSKRDVVATQPFGEMYACMQLNISSCPVMEDGKNFVLSIYNPLSRPVTTNVRLPVVGNSYIVTDTAAAVEVTSQIVPIPVPVIALPGRVSKATNELVFRAMVPSLGYKVFTVEDNSQEKPKLEEPASIENDLYDVSIDSDGRVKVEWKKENNMNFVQSFNYYEGMEGDNKVFETRSSGAYIFRPKQISAKNFAYAGTHQIFTGPVVQEIHQTINPWVSQVIRIYNGDEHVEFDWLVGPIPIKDKIGKEIVTTYSSNLESDDEFYTDSNGREMLKRKRNFRPTWKLRLQEPVAGNYYPVTSKISIKEKKRSLKLNVLTDRAQGGTSMHNGQMELMLHRRLLRDDAFGVGEALNESAYGEGLVVRGTHYVFGGSAKNLDAFALKEKNLALEMSLRPWTFISPVSKSNLEEWRSTRVLEASGLAKPLPPNVHILTLEPWKDGRILLRLEHLFEVGEALQLSQPVEVNIQDLFSTLTIVHIEETTLGGNQWLKDMDRLKWKTETNNVLEQQESNNVPQLEIDETVTNILLKPMQIRTFVVKVSNTVF